jgi:hypothetical protein
MYLIFFSFNSQMHLVLLWLGHAVLLLEKYSFISNVCETGFNKQFSLK